MKNQHRGRSTRRNVAALLSPLVITAGMTGIAGPAHADDVVPVAPPHDIGVFPMRDFLGVGGWGVGAEMNIRVIRDGVQIGRAGPLTLAEDAEHNGFGEVNHPGGICWSGSTPDLVAGDRIEAVDADGHGDYTVVQNVEVTQPATLVDADNDGRVDDIIAKGLASNIEGTGRIDPGLVEQRIINPELNNTSIGRRDVRAIFGSGGVADGVATRGQIRWDVPADTTNPHWTATYLNMVEPHTNEDTGALTGKTSGDLAVEGQSRMLAWERTNAANDRIGMTLWEYGEVGGPGMGGCPLREKYHVGGSVPENINKSTSTRASLTLSGEAHDVDTVTVSVDDHDPLTPAVTAAATVTNPVNMTDPTVEMPGNTTWRATLPMADLLQLDDDTLVASATYGRVTESTAPADHDNNPATADQPVTTRTSQPIGGATLNILKDLQAPASPTAFPAGGRYTSAQSVTVRPASVEDVVRYVNGPIRTVAAVAATSPVVPVPLQVTATQRVTLRSFDPAGNPSAPMPLDYTIAPNSVPDAPTGASATAGSAQATVSWTAPVDDGGTPITGYVVQTFRGTAFVKENAAPSNAGSALITGLANGTAYTFQVIAVNSIGRSAPSAASAPVTPQGTVAPTVTPASGTYTSARSVTMTAAAGTTIRYTVGAGTTVPAAPTATTGTLYTGPVSVTSSQIIRAAAFSSAGVRSTVVRRNYTINAPTTAAPARPVIGTPIAGSTADTAVTATAVWTQPTTGGAPTSFIVRAFRVTSAGTTLARSVTVQSETARRLAMTLQAGNYRFSVQAVNAAGSSTQSARSVVVAAQ